MLVGALSGQAAARLGRPSGVAVARYFCRNRAHSAALANGCSLLDTQRNQRISDKLLELLEYEAAAAGILRDRAHLG